MYTSIRDEITREIRNGNVIMQIIALNVAVFVLVVLTGLFIKLFLGQEVMAQKMEQILGWLMVPSNLRVLMWRPWTLVTHMFLHYEIFHILFNMLVFFWFGKIIQEFIGNKKLFPLYIYGGLSGALFFILSYNIFPGLYAEASTATALGASAAVMAVVVAAATLVPDYTIFLLFLGAVRIKYVALFMVISDLAMATLIPNTGGHIAHLGGALFGYIFIKQLQAGYDWSKPFNNFFESIGRFFSSRKQPRVVYKTTAQQAKKKPRTAEFTDEQQQRVDEILDKIKRSGYDSLSKEEKEFLFRVSNQER